MKPARRAFDGGYATCSLQSLTTCSLQSLGGPPVPRRVKPAALRRCTYAGRSDATSFDRLPTLLLAELLRFVEDIAALSAARPYSWRWTDFDGSIPLGAALADVSRSHALPGLVHCELVLRRRAAFHQPRPCRRTYGTAAATRLTTGSARQRRLESNLARR